MHTPYMTPYQVRRSTKSILNPSQEQNLGQFAETQFAERERQLAENYVKAGIRMAVGDDKIADFTVDNYAALKLKHPQRETCSAPDPTDIDCFQPRNLGSTGLFRREQ